MKNKLKLEVKNYNELKQLILRLRREQFKLRLLSMSGNFNKFHLFKEKKKILLE